MTNKKTIDKLIESSGIITHKKVIDILRNQGWKLLIGPYYYDNISNTVREIDIIAEKRFNSSLYPGQSSVQVNVQLFIECKYINQEFVLWFDEKDIDKAVLLMEQNSGLKIAHRRQFADIIVDNFHYLTAEKVAKLFSKKNNNDDVIYKAITQCLNAQIYYDQWYGNPIFFDFTNIQEIATKILKFPLIICDNFENLIKVDFNEDGSYKNENIRESFQIETNYTFLDKDKVAKTEYFLIDMLNIQNIDVFLVNLEKEIGSIMHATDLKRF